VVNLSHHNDVLASLRVVRVMDHNVERLFLGSMSWDRAASGNPGWLAHSASRHAGKTSRCSISASLDYLLCWLWDVVMVVTPS
jgi:hypothetical protein